MACTQNFGAGLLQTSVLMAAWLFAVCAHGASRATVFGYFGKAEYLNSTESSVAMNEGTILSAGYSRAFQSEKAYPWEGAIVATLTLGQAGKSKFLILPRFSWSSLTEDFAPFVFSVGFGAGPTLLFLKSANYAALSGQLFLATEIALGEGIYLGGESCVEMPLTSSRQNRPSLSVLLRLSYRDSD